ncbi:MAG: Gfo/Idh/MocA family oxidoreductase [Thermomicrobiales bacterium]
MEPVRLIVVGLGSFGPGWARLVHATPEVELAAVVEPMDERRNTVAAELGLAPDQAQRDLATALLEVDADAVIVVTPPQTHLDVARVAIEQGKPVLVEKPLAATMDDARAIVALAEEAGCCWSSARTIATGHR